VPATDRGRTAPAVPPAPAAAPAATKAQTQTYTPYTAPPATSIASGAQAGPGPYNAFGDVPGGEQNVLKDLRNQFEQLIGFTQDISDAMLLQAANAHMTQSLSDFSKFATTNGIKTDNYPWAQYGLSKDEYASTAGIFATEYKKVTGQDISQSALQDAFKNPRDATGNLLTGSQYQQQLMQDANIQLTYGWVKFGMDYSAWTAQKLQSRTSFGRDIQDTEASAMLMYNHAATGATASVTAKQTGQQTQQPAGVGGSVVR
jgi:hypothetical protein